MRLHKQHTRSQEHIYTHKMGCSQCLVMNDAFDNVPQPRFFSSIRDYTEKHSEQNNTYNTIRAPANTSFPQMINVNRSYCKNARRKLGDTPDFMSHLQLKMQLV